MDTLLFDDEQEQIQDMLRKFSENEIKPLAAKRDEEEYFDWGIFKKMAENGLTGIPWPEEYGGAGLDYVAFINAIEEFSKVCGATGADMSIHTALASFPIYQFGTEEQKRTHLKALAAGESLGSFSLTEPSHGSDYESLNTRAVKKGGEYVINGDKVFTSNAGLSDIYIVFAQTTPKTEESNGAFSAFIVEKGTEGFNIGKPERKMGIRGHAACAIHFDDCHIPAENLLGEEGQGYKIAKQTLYGGRLAMSAQALGIAEGAYELAVEHVQSREQFGKHLSDFQTIRFKIAEMATQIEAARLLVYQAAMLQTKGEDFHIQSAMCKSFVPNMAMKITTDVVQLFGGYGFTREYPVERMMRDAKITQIYTGTVQMQQIEIADSILD